MTELARDDWHRIEHVLHDRVATMSSRYEPPVAVFDPLTLAKRLVALALEYDQDAQDARQAAASCRAYAADLRAGMG